MGALLAWAIALALEGRARRGGRPRASWTCVPRSEVDQGNYGNVFLVLIGGPIVGYMCASLQRMARERDAAEHAAAAAEERTRLARAVHDGVLQVLAMTQRRGAAAGGEWAELGRLAGEQERSLRSLIRQQDTVPTAAGGQVDLAGALEAMATAHPVRVEVATPGTAVLVDAHVATETVAAVRACLDNVARPRRPDASAWVLAQAAPDAVTVSVRDDGPASRPGGWTRPRTRVGWASSPRSAAGSRTSAAPPRGERDVGHRVGARRPGSAQHGQHRRVVVGPLDRAVSPAAAASAAAPRARPRWRRERVRTTHSLTDAPGPSPPVL